MINITKYSNLNEDNEIVSLLKNSFKSNKKELNLVNKKTIIINLIINKQKIGTVSLISNNHLIQHLKKNSNIEDIKELYLFRAVEGIYIYNLAVKKEFRGNKIAQKLIDVALYVAKNLNNSYCYTHCENDISEYIFKKKNFNKENIFKNSKKQNIRLMSYWLN